MIWLAVFFTFLGIWQLLSALLPNFNRQKELVRRAIQISRSGRKSTPAWIGWFQTQVTKLLLRSSGLFPSSFQIMVKTCTPYERIEDFFAVRIVWATVWASPIGIALLFSGQSLIWAVLFWLFFIYWRVHELKQAFNQLQRDMMADLPQFIEKMMMALETGKSFITVFRELEKQSKPRMKRLIQNLNTNFQDGNIGFALEQFAKETTIPIMVQFSAAIKIGIQVGYEESKAYLEDLKEEMYYLRKQSLIAKTQRQPGRIKMFQIMLTFCSIISVIICFVYLIGQFSKLF